MRLKEEMSITGMFDNKLVEGNIYYKDNASIVYDNDNNKSYRLKDLTNVKLFNGKSLNENEIEFDEMWKAKLESDFDSDKVANDSDAFKSAISNTVDQTATKFGLNKDDAKEKVNSLIDSKVLDSAVKKDANGNSMAAQKELEPYLKEAKNINIVARKVVEGSMPFSMYKKGLLIEQIKDAISLCELTNNKQYLVETTHINRYVANKLLENTRYSIKIVPALVDRFEYFLNESTLPKDKTKEIVNFISEKIRESVADTIKKVDFTLINNIITKIEYFIDNANLSKAETKKALDYLIILDEFCADYQNKLTYLSNKNLKEGILKSMKSINEYLANLDEVLDNVDLDPEQYLQLMSGLKNLKMLNINSYIDVLSKPTIKESKKAIDSIKDKLETYITSLLDENKITREDVYKIMNSYQNIEKPAKELSDAEKDVEASLINHIDDLIINNELTDDVRVLIIDSFFNLKSLKEKTVNLRCITAENNNKFYNMIDNNNGTFTASYGREGISKPQTKVYPISDWDKIYKSKTARKVGAYTDVTALDSDKLIKALDENDPNVVLLLDFLSQCSVVALNTVFGNNMASISAKQLDKVQTAIDIISKIIEDFEKDVSVSNDINNMQDDDVKQINDNILNILLIFPRKSKNTSNIFCDKSYNFISKLKAFLRDEQDKKDNIETQLSIFEAKSDNNEDNSVLGRYGIELRAATDAERLEIINKTDFKLTDHKVFRITNPKTNANFVGGRNIKLLYHGSRNENFMSILVNGLRIRPSGVKTTGSMLGNGIYGANTASKSIGYTSLTGSKWADGKDEKAYLAIFEFALGKQFDFYKNLDKVQYPEYIDYETIKKFGCDSVYAASSASSAKSNLKKDEYVVYNENQCNIKYLIELKR